MNRSPTVTLSAVGTVTVDVATLAFDAVAS